MWVADFDENVLDPEKSSLIPSFIYNTHEVRKLRDYLSGYVDHPVKASIDLLTATYIFLCQTDQTVEFIEMRKRKKDVELKSIIDKMAYAIETAQNHLHSLSKGSEEHRILSNALQYCLQSILKQVREMKEKNDEIYQKFYPESSLQKILKKEKISL